MTVQKQITIGLGVSLLVSMLTILPLNSLSLFSGMGIAYAIGGAALLVIGPVAVCSIPAGIHWLIWRDRLNGNELAIWTIWFFACLSLVLATISQVFMQ